MIRRWLTRFFEDLWREPEAVWGASGPREGWKGGPKAWEAEKERCRALGLNPWTLKPWETWDQHQARSKSERPRLQAIKGGQTG